MKREIAMMRMLVSCVLCAGAGVGVEVASGQSEVGMPRSAIVMVRDFTNVTGVPADDWMGVGIVETVSTSL